MAKNKKLTKEDILHIAKLANLTIEENEIEDYRKKLDETINYVENLNSLDTKNIQPTSHSTDLENVFFEDGTENKRQFSQKQALKNAKSTKKSMFLVPKIM